MKYFSCITLVLSLGLTGCGMLPKPGMLSKKEVAETDRSIIDGKTTEKELLALYGDKPLVEKTAQGKNVLNWQQGWSSGFSANTTVLSTLVDNNIVIKHVVFRYKTRTNFSFLKNISDADLNSFISAGKTTRKVVEGKYGKPNGNSFDDNGNPIMIYIYTDASRSKYGWIPNVGGFVEALAGTISAKVTVLRIRLDDQDIVQSYQIKTNNYRQGIGLLNAGAPKEVN